MENCNSHSNPETRKGHAGGKFPPDRVSSILGKIAEKIILTRLYQHVDTTDTNNILIPEQHGFRPNLSTTHQL
ncbi:hypothetical protein TNCV_3531931 [Trichonephila clavipes]|nr:hypothetical protein TNCV_3531931 [Trichonephila clavipes]